MASTLATEPLKAVKTRRRDWLFLPLVGLLTVCVLLGSLEVAGDILLPRHADGVYNCMVFTPTGARGVPNTVCRHRLPEGQPVEYRFNQCGDRDAVACGPKPPGSYRIVTVGSSMVFGYGVPREKSWPTLLAGELSRESGRDVDVYNKGMMWEFPKVLALRFDEVLASKPDAILWLFTAYDIEDPPWRELEQRKPVEIKNASVVRKLNFFELAWSRAKAAFSGKSVREALMSVWLQSRSELLLRHLVYESQSQYVQSTLARGDDALKAEPGAKLQEQLRQFDHTAAEMEAKAKANNVRFLAVLLPDRAQAALVSLNTWPEGVDPYKIDDEVGSIITSHGGTFIDLFRNFRNIPNPERYYLPVDGHPDETGHALITSLLARQLMSAVPELQATHAQRR